VLVRKVYVKTRNAASLLRDEGVGAFSAKVLSKFKDNTVQKPSDKTNLSLRVKYSDLINLDPAKKPKKWTGTDKSVLNIGWVMPPPGPGSGGHMNIFRFIKFLEDAGHKCIIYLYADGGGGSLLKIKEIVASPSYPQVKANIHWLKDDNVLNDVDAIFATSWETAYAVFNSPNHAKRFYFVQDFEPYFYPLGSMYKLAENSYKFGFHGITAGGWLASKLEKEYSMATDYFDFGADEKMYKYDNAGKRKEIFFYARPYTERRGFEIGLAALDIFHKKHPEFTINFAGWDTSNVNVPFPYNNLKTLDISELNALYNRCAVGLVLSYTNMSLLPLELLSSGTIPVVNDADNNRMVSNNEYIAYCGDTPQEIAKEISSLVELKNLPDHAKKASASISTKSWAESGSKFVKIIEKRVKNG
jgi:O-antigen biosynthesis protein